MFTGAFVPVSHVKKTEVKILGSSSKKEKKPARARKVEAAPVAEEAPASEE